MTRVRIKFRTKEVLSNWRIEIRRKMELIAAVVVETADRLLKIPGGGVPSKPGEAPRAQSGDLRKSISSTVTMNPLEVVLKYGTIKGIVPYARRLELGFKGTDSKGRVYDMKPRPYLKPSYLRNKNTIRKILTRG